MMYVTRNARWRSRRPRYNAAIQVPDFVPAPELSLPIQLCRHISKGIIFASKSGNESVEIRYVNGSFEAGTSASSPGVSRHICSIWAVTLECICWKNNMLVGIKIQHPPFKI